MKFKTKLYIGFGFLFGLFITSYLVFIFVMEQLDKNTGEVVDNYEMLYLANTIESQMGTFSRESIGTIADPPPELVDQLDKNKEEAISNIHKAIAALERLDSRESSQELIQRLKEMSETYEAIEEEADQLRAEGNMEALKTLYWYEGRSAREEMMEVAKELQVLQQQTAAEKLNQSSDMYSLLKKMIVIYALVGFAIGVGMAIWTMRSITGNLNKVTTVMNKVAFRKSNKWPRIDISSKDEIGDIAVAFNEMAGTLEAHAREEEKLKHAAEEQSWLKTKVAEVATMYPGIDNLETLAQRFITKVTPMVGASYGVFYIRTSVDGEETFQKQAAYAYNHEDPAKDSFRLGEGIIGQCALEKRAMLMDHVPENYIRITSGLGSASPANVLVVPAEFQGEVLAVIELATLEPFKEGEKQLLKEVMGGIGINIKSIMRHMQIEKLLEESQSLTEELQLQQEELRTVNEQLEEQYENSEQKTKELEKIKLILEEKAQQLTLNSQYKSEFLANMSHELRTPLNSLLILAQMLAENASGNLTDKQVEYAKTIFSSGNDLLRLINDILDIAKVEAGKMEVIFEDVNIKDVQTFVETQFAPLAREKGVQLSVQLADELPETIYTDKQRLQQVLMNLLSNAFKFTHEGIVSLCVEKAQNKAARGPYTEADIAFIVKDTGIGIPKHKQEEIFEAFKQADGTISRKYGGTGLGLSISREIAHLLGGSIEVQSAEHQGSTFTLRVPQDQPHQQPEQSAASAEVAAGLPPQIEEPPPIKESHAAGSEKRSNSKTALLEGKKILIVDDDMRNIFALTTALESYHVDVLFAENGREGIDMLNGNPDIDLVLMDIMMPEINGFEAIRLIRKQAEFEQLPIIALTAKAMKDDRKRCIEAGASDYISKPVNLEQLFSTMRVWLYR